MTARTANLNVLRRNQELDRLSDLSGFDLSFRNTHPLGSEECLTTEVNLSHELIGFNVVRRFKADGSPDEPGWTVRVRVLRRGANGKELWTGCAPALTPERIAVLQKRTGATGPFVDTQHGFDTLKEALDAALHPENCAGLHGGCKERSDDFRAQVAQAVLATSLTDIFREDHA